MGEIRVERGMPAMKEIVLAEAARLQKLGHWPETLALASGAAAPDAEELQGLERFRWRIDRTDADGGWFEVADQGAGGSQATVVLRLDDHPGADAVQRSIEDALAALHDSVLQRVNDAS